MLGIEEPLWAPDQENETKKRGQGLLTLALPTPWAEQFLRGWEAVLPTARGLAAPLASTHQIPVASPPKL